jgi:hypothetical protein
MAKCEQCGTEVDLPFECNFCGSYFCIEHRLPENHNCPNQPPRTPLGSWQTKKEMVFANVIDRQIEAQKSYPKKGKRKFAIIGVAIICIVLTFLLLFYNLPVINNKDQNVTFSSLPFEEDFHISNGFLQAGSKEYYFNVTLATEFVIYITSDEPINFRLFNIKNNITAIERNSVQTVYDSTVVKRGIWVVSISPSNSHANGIIRIATQTPLYSYMYVRMYADREGSNITMNYEDKLEETVSVHLTIMLEDFTTVWNHTESGLKRNKFSMTWSKANKFKDYIVEIIAEHRVFGNLTFRTFVLGQLP